jgi:hypothetical protein
VASAWCAYQSALWNGEQIRAMAKSNEAHFASLRKWSVANSMLLIDVGTFLNFVEDHARGAVQASEYVRRHARPEFRPVLEAWIADVQTKRDGAELPFKRPEYNLREAREAEALDRQAAVSLNQANEANANGDLFVMHTVFFALALFFLGAAAQASHRLVRRSMLVFGALAFLLASLSMSRIPRARAERMSQRHADTALPETKP